MIWVIARREWVATFQTPLGWLLLATNQALLGWIFLRVLDGFTGLAPPERSAGLNLELAHNLFGSAAVLMLLAAPLLAARGLSGEAREGTFELLGAAPVSLLQILLGKLAALAGLMLLVALLPLGLCLTLLGAAPIDIGLLLAATLGLWLVCVLFCAAGLFAASLTSQPAAAAVIAYAILVLLSVINRADQLAGEAISVFDWLSWSQHLFWFQSGVVRVSDLGYFVLMSALFLALAHRGLANRRLG